MAKITEFSLKFLCVNPIFPDLRIFFVLKKDGFKMKQTEHTEQTEQTKQNKMATEPVKKLIRKMGLPMIVSMVLQALYNVVDSVFVANMQGSGALANEALTIAFPIQIMIIAVSVGTGVGLNAMLSKCLGERNKEKVDAVAGNGIFLCLVIYAVFLLFGLFLSEWFIGLFTENDTVKEMGAAYLKICVCFSLGSIGFAVYERFLQATGKTMLSTIAQISGALTNIVLDYVFIFPLDMGVAGAAWGDDYRSVRFAFRRDGSALFRKQGNRRQPEIYQTARRYNHFDIQNRRFRRDNAGSALRYDGGNERDFRLGERRLDHFGRLVRNLLQNSANRAVFGVRIVEHDNNSPFL